MQHITHEDAQKSTAFFAAIKLRISFGLAKGLQLGYTDIPIQKTASLLGQAFFASGPCLCGTDQERIGTSRSFIPH